MTMVINTFCNVDNKSAYLNELAVEYQQENDVRFYSSFCEADLRDAIMKLQPSEASEIADILDPDGDIFAADQWDKIEIIAETCPEEVIEVLNEYFKDQAPDEGDYGDYLYRKKIEG